MVNRGALLIAMAILFGIYCFLLGDSGLIKRYRLIQEKRNIEARTVRLEQKNKLLAQVYERYKNGYYSPEDFLKAGFLGAYEKLLYLKKYDGKVEKDEATAPSAEERGFDVELRYLRIFWLLVSAAVISIMILRKQPAQDD